MTEPQEFCLRWNNHQATIISVFDYLLENETLVDCTLAAEGQYLKAHKVVLCACSPYLELLLSQHNDKHPILIFKDIKYHELKCMIEYMYKGEVNIAQDQLNHFLKAAESLQIKGLSESEEDATPQTAVPTPRPPPPRAPPVQRTQPRPFSNAVAVRSTGPSEVEDSAKRLIGRTEAQSPTPRKRRRQAPLPLQGRSSISGDDASNASEGHFDQSNCDVPTPAHPASTPSDSSKAVAKVETNSELMLEPKTEYDDNDNSVEDITLDDDDEDYSQAGTSQMDNSQGNFGSWQQMVGDQTGDEVFSGQDSGAQNSQEFIVWQEEEGVDFFEGDVEKRTPGGQPEPVTCIDAVGEADAEAGNSKEVLRVKSIGELQQNCEITLVDEIDCLVASCKEEEVPSGSLRQILSCSSFGNNILEKIWLDPVSRRYIAAAIVETEMGQLKSITETIGGDRWKKWTAEIIKMFPKENPDVYYTEFQTRTPGGRFVQASGGMIHDRLMHIRRELAEKEETPIETPIEIPIENHIETPVENRIETRIENPVENRIETRIENPVEKRTETQLKKRTKTQLKKHTKTQIKKRTKTHIENRTETHIETRNDAKRRDSMPARRYRPLPYQFDIEREEDDVEKARDGLHWLKFSSKPEYVVDDKWHKTLKERLKMIHDDGYLKYIGKFPALRCSWGHKLLERDFDTIYKQANESFDKKFPAEKTKLLQLLENKVDQVSKVESNIQTLRKLSKLGEAEATLAALLAIPHLLDKMHTFTIQGTRRSIYPTVQQVQESFLPLVPTVAHIASHRSKRLKAVASYNENLVPYVVAVGPNWERVKGFHLVLTEKIRYRFPAALPALVALYKILWALDVPYPQEARLVWTFIQTGMFAMPSSSA